MILARVRSIRKSTLRHLKTLVQRFYSSGQAAGKPDLDYLVLLLVVTEYLYKKERLVDTSVIIIYRPPPSIEKHDIHKYRTNCYYTRSPEIHFSLRPAALNGA